MKQISILGCGWLGLPLAKAMLENGFSVNGSTTSSEKLSVLKNSGIQPFLITLSENKVDGDPYKFLENSKILIIDIPPKLRSLEQGSSSPLRRTFVEKIKNIIPYIEKSTVEKVLFISSTSVYGGSDSMVTEETIPLPNTESGRQLLQSEQLLQTNQNFKTTVLRFGGLIGEDRHPVRFLAGKKNLDNPMAPINLIHQNDCSGVILAILQQNCWGKTLNAVTPYHPSRKDYYTQKAIEKNLDLPEFKNEFNSVGKTILNGKIISVLKYTFTEPNL
ncbi:NAD-dependent epimerase/dehydratase family protein [Flavobacterium cellulosilyticum]|uniref:SDR family NAD(P)-dependent oxidoreductase n=1 Tax=Flavobacterium cellulosilyticum TaxID=2541731 RepID=A0A4R5CHI2_9FLAO|nr:NAD-dependent epimerase/dehydratase family protein [Flavobacterium cellulosilyticum]TDD99658.1 SDR family NAD(P)-dependent oxidoreductase [Flavobacterium cellulosilyticum]